jgi:hypothetical protein
LKITDEKKQDPEPEPYPLVKDTDPQIWIRTKMSRIRNTAVESILLPSTMIDIVSNGEVDEIKYLQEFESSIKS